MQLCEPTIQHAEVVSDVETTNNRMELLAVIEGLKRISLDRKIEIYTDSSYVERGLKRFLSRIKLYGYSPGLLFCMLPKSNVDLWRELWQTLEHLTVTVHRVRRNSNPQNEECDNLCKTAIESYESSGLECFDEAKQKRASRPASGQAKPSKPLGKLKPGQRRAELAD